ncbi:MAG TPA: glycosyltransferase [Candidatus Fimivivens sp.]|nr:glycosyltransferase [Candidatus Fimivivens sp.]
MSHIDSLKRLPTVAVAIPAHNEEDNIARLLSSVISQDSGTYELDKVIVVLDGCTDRTEEIVAGFAREHPSVELLSDGKRVGKSARMNDIFRRNTSDILVAIDADLTLGSDDFISEIIRPLSDDGVGVVAANNRPAFPPRTVLERILIARDRWWYDVRKDFNGGDNPDNSPGQCYAFRREFVDRLDFPDGLMHDHFFIYLMTMEIGKRFVFAEGAKVIYREVANWNELVVRARRHAHVDRIDMAEFRFTEKDIPKIPCIRKMKGLLRMFLREPIPIAVSVLLLIAAVKIAVLTGTDNPMHSRGLWERSESTKHA